MIKASHYAASVPITIPEPTERDLEIREAAAEMGRHVRFIVRAECRAAGLTEEPKCRIMVAGGFEGSVGPGTPIEFGGGRLDEMLPGEAEWIERWSIIP